MSDMDSNADLDADLVAIAEDTDEIERLQRQVTAVQERRRERIRTWMAGRSRIGTDIKRATGLSATQITRICEGTTSGRKLAAGSPED